MKSQTVTQAVLDFLEEAAYLARQTAGADTLTAAERQSIGDRLAEIAAAMGIAGPSRSRG